MIPYITIYYVVYGMYAQFLLGIIQLLIAIILLFFKKNFTSTIKRHLINYWKSVIIIAFILLIICISNNLNDSITPIVIVFIIPMLIATYFVYITYLIQKQ